MSQYRHFRDIVARGPWSVKAARIRNEAGCFVWEFSAEWIEANEVVVVRGPWSVKVARIRNEAGHFVWEFSAEWIETNEVVVVRGP